MSDEMAIYLVPYDERWPAQFEAERASLQSILQPWLRGGIEHVGSTAVTGLSAKPVIDIMAGVESLEESRACFADLRAAGYQHADYRTEVMHWFCKPDFSHRTHHLHLVPYASAMWIERIAFRDYLRSNAAVAAEYAELKARLAARHPSDREAYTDAKGPFIARVVSAALGHERR
jgi:GrpB-like predicted nucleotidyltransferase (UPF0157 family)